MTNDGVRNTSTSRITSTKLTDTVHEHEICEHEHDPLTRSAAAVFFVLSAVIGLRSAVLIITNNGHGHEAPSEGTMVFSREKWNLLRNQKFTEILPTKTKKLRNLDYWGTSKDWTF